MELLPEVSPVFACAATIIGEIFPIYASLSKVSPEFRSPREFSLGSVIMEVSLWRCIELLPEVSLVFICTETTVGEVSPTYARRPEVSMELHPPRGFSFGFVANVVSLWRCTELLPKVSPVFACAMTIVGEVSHVHQSSRDLSGIASSP